uniref:C. briggsae CBR-SNF-1 protein n=1 Tax=Haemonchus contortus TaxID=6289 RepID=W6NAX8_HAECO
MMQVITVVGLVGFVVSKTGLAPFDVMDKGEAQMWHILTYFSYLPNVKLWSGLLLFASICILLNIFYLLSLSVLATLEDALGDRWSRCFPRFVLALFVCCLCFSISLYFATQAGRHAYELVTGYLKYITIFVILTFELFATAWFYCAHRLGMDLHVMLRNACCWCFGHFVLLFTYLLPVIPAAVALLNLHDYDFSTFSPAIHSWPYSEWLGAAVALGPLLPIPLVLFFTILCACCCRGKQGYTRGQRLRNVFASNLRRDQRDKSNQRRMHSSRSAYHVTIEAILILSQ